jgi:hypothetical protein
VIQGTRLYFDGKGPVPVTGTPTTEVSNRLTGPLIIWSARAKVFI